MLRMSENHAELRVVEDQISGPTPAQAIATACLEIVRQLQADPGKSGTYHFSNAADVSWRCFACTVFSAAGRVIRVKGIPTHKYPTPALRPLKLRLDCGTRETTFNIPCPDWRAGLVDPFTDKETSR